MASTLRVIFDGKVLIPSEPLQFQNGETLECSISRPQSTEVTAGLRDVVEELSRFPSDPDSPTDAAAEHDHYLYDTSKRCDRDVVLATDGAQISTDEKRFNAITERIIGCAYKVAGKLGSGFLEKCYENAMVYELRKAGLTVKQQVPLAVYYDNIIIGEYVADLIVENAVVVELKAIEQLAGIHSAQCINYLAATRLPLCLLINFSRKVEIRRLAGPTLNGKS